MTLVKADGAYTMALPEPMDSMTLSFVPTSDMMGVGFGMTPVEVRARMAAMSGDKVSMASNMKVVADMAAMADLLSDMLDQVEASPMFGMAEAAMAEEGVDYALYRS